MSPISLTPELQALLAALIGFAVTAGLKDLGKVVGVDFTSVASAVTGALVTGIVFFANALLAQLPANVQPIAVVVMPLLAAIFAAYGVHRTAARFGPTS